MIYKGVWKIGGSFNLYLQNKPLKEILIINTDSPDALNNIEQIINNQDISDNRIDEK